MKKFEKLLKGHKYVLFMDFEGTQFTHEMIAIGAVLAKLKPNGTFAPSKKPFKVYVKAKNKIGNYVVNLTGITEDKLKKEGISFAKAMTLLKKYCGLAFKKASFCTFGNHDMKIVSQSFIYNIDSPKDIVSQIQKNYIDFTVFMNELMRDEKGSALSLIHSIELLGAKPEGEPHDPEFDAINLMNLYNLIVTNPTKILEEYKKAIVKGNHLPDPIRIIVEKLTNGESVTPEDYEDALRKQIQ